MPRSGHFVKGKDQLSVWILGVALVMGFGESKGVGDWMVAKELGLGL